MTNFLALSNPDLSQSHFEKIKHVDEQGNKYWSARELMPLLDYANWQSFKRVIQKAKTACVNSNHNVTDHFIDAMKAMESSRSTRQVGDIRLSRFACYLIFQNADPSKSAVALAKTYIAMQTYKRERADQLTNLESAASIFYDALIEDKQRRL